MRDRATSSSTEPRSFKYALVKLGDSNVDIVTNLEMGSRGGSLPAASQFRADRIHPGDVLSIAIFEASSEAGGQGLFSSSSSSSSDHSGGSVTLPNQQVDSTGNIRIPFAGQIRVIDQSPNEVSGIIAKQLAKRALEPQVVVTIVDRRSEGVSVLGDVATPAHFSIDPGGVTLLEAIARTGGTKSQSFETQIVLQRRSREYKAMLSDVIAKPKNDVQLAGGDVVFLVHKPDYVTVFGATSNTTNTSITHRVTFESEKMTLAETLGKVNGLDDTRADPKQVFVLRNERKSTLAALGVDVSPYDGDNVATVFPIDLNTAEGLFVANRIQMRTQDVIVASDSGWVDFTKFFTAIDLPAYGGSLVGSAYTNFGGK